MKQLIKPLAVLVAFAVLAVPRLATAQPASAIPPTITTPEKVETPHRHARLQGRRAERGDRWRRSTTTSTSRTPFARS